MMPLRRLVSIDLDDTLWNIEQTIVRAEKRIADFAYDYLGNEYPTVRQFFLCPEVKKEAYIANKHLLESCNLSEYRKGLFKHALLRAGHPGSEEVIDNLYTEYYRHRNDVIFFDGAREFLEHITHPSSESERYLLVALTNGNADLASVGIQSAFHAHVKATMECMRPKPDPSMFHYTLQITDGLRTHHTPVHVGDDPVRDVAAARGSGFRTVWVNVLQKEWPKEIPRADAEVTHLADLHGVLKSLFEAPHKL